MHHTPNQSGEKQTTGFERPESTALSAATEDETHSANDHLHGAVGALPTEQRRLIEQLFWEGHTEVEVANTMSIIRSLSTGASRRF